MAEVRPNLAGGIREQLATIRAEQVRAARARGTLLDVSREQREAIRRHVPSMAAGSRVAAPPSALQQLLRERPPFGAVPLTPLQQLVQEGQRVGLAAGIASARLREVTAGLSGQIAATDGARKLLADTAARSGGLSGMQAARPGMHATAKTARRRPQTLRAKPHDAPGQLFRVRPRLPLEASEFRPVLVRLAATAEEQLQEARHARRQDELIEAALTRIADAAEAQREAEQSAARWRRFAIVGSVVMALTSPVAGALVLRWLGL